MEELARGGRHGGSLEMKLLYTTPEYFEYSGQLLSHLQDLNREVGVESPWHVGESGSLRGG